MVAFRSARRVLVGACAASWCESPRRHQQAQNPTEAMGGTKAAGSSKDSPYAAAKDDTSITNVPTLQRLWTLVVPIGLAAGSYIWLRSRERGSFS